MKTVTMHEAKTHLSRLLERVENGERMVIARAGKPVAELGPLTRRPFRFGSTQGPWRIDCETFEADDRAADEEIRAMFDSEIWPVDPS